MNDLGGISHSFTEWSAVVDFLTGVKMDRSKVKSIHIAPDNSTGWRMRIDENKENDKTKLTRTTGAALYDLNW